MLSANLRLSFRYWTSVPLRMDFVFAKLGERPTILDSHSDKVLKDFIDQKRDEKDVQKSLIRYFGVQHHQQGRD